MLDANEIGSWLEERNASACVIVHLSKLAIKREDTQHIDIAMNVANDQVRQYNAEVFLTQTNDMAIIFKHGDTSVMNNAIYQLRYLFADDPLSYNKQGLENPEFCSVFTSNGKIDFTKKASNIAANQNDNIAAQIDEIHLHQKGPINLHHIIENALESALSLIDWNNAIIVNGIHLNQSNEDSKIVMYELLINHRLIQAAIGKYEAQLNELRSILDLRLLIKLLSFLQIGKKSVYISLSLNTISTEEFDMFDQSINADARHNIVIAINISEIIADIERYFSAVSKLKAYGYKIAIDGIDNYNFSMIDREYLQADFLSCHVKSLAFDIESMKRNSISRIIAHCDSASELQYAKEWKFPLYKMSKYTTL